MRRLLSAIAGAMLIAGAAPAAAAEPYLDDRSSAESLVRSLYNAINRKEYARAYGYFDTPPADSLEAYAQGYADTERVALRVGPALEEGAAGSVVYQVPVALAATAADGSERRFAGCYTLRLANPQIQGTPFKPLHITGARLAIATEPLDAALPTRCGDRAVPAGDALLQRARAVFAAHYDGICQSLAPDAAPDAAEPEAHTIRFNYAYDDPDQPQREARLFRFWCFNGAYNEIHVYVLANDAGEVLPLSFATPELDIRYRDDASETVEDLRIIGYTAQDRLVNSGYDPQTLSISAHAKWRGLGDAASDGLWIFRDGRFTLVRYDVDASYDGEINPVTVLDHHTGP